MDQPNDDLVVAKTTPAPLNTSLDPSQAGLSSEQPPLNAGLIQGFADYALDFLSTSSNEALLGAFVLLVLLTYLIMGRVGLLLIGVALGIVMHASWEGIHRHDEGGLRLSKRRKELALEVSRRLLEWPKSSVQGACVTGHDTALAAAENLSARDLEYDTFQPATAVALRLLTDAAVRDYVKYWYDPILPKESTFPNSCRRTLTHFVIAISSHISRKRKEDTFLQFLTNASSIIIVFLNELAAAFAAVSGSATEAQTVIDQYLESAPDSSLANILSGEEQRKKLNVIADDILSNFLDPKAYDCSPVRDFLREIFATVVLESTVISLSRPEFINDWIVYLLQDGESEIMHAIDAGVEGARNQAIGTSGVSDDAKKLPLESKEQTTGETVIIGQSSAPNDQATEEALIEAKRLSAIMPGEKGQSSSERLANHEHPQMLHHLSYSTHEPSTQPTTETSDSDAMVEDRMSSSDPPGPGAPISPGLQEIPKLSSRGDISVPPVRLHDARVMVDDDGAGIERGPIKSRPTWDYLLQIEPASTRSTGWMVFRKYSDFLSLHEMLETVSRLNRIQSFSTQFPTLPSWKGKTRQTLARDLEAYLQQAVKHESLAETDRMRRFLEKEGGPSEMTPNKPVFSFPNQSALENMGKGVLGALTNAPKGMAGGGRAVFEGMTGVFGGGGHSRKPTNTPEQQTQHRTNASHSKIESTQAGWTHDLASDRSSTGLTQDGPPSVLRKSEGDDPSASLPTPVSFVESARGEISDLPSPSNRSSGAYVTVDRQDAWASESTPTTSEDRKSLDSNGRDEEAIGAEQSTSASPESQIESVSDSESAMRPQRQPITVDETHIAVELIFAVINELYTLSSAWNIRRTLLNAAKTYILRPGSPILETIRDLLQDSMIETHTSDEALGEYVRKLRENALPTEAELKAWPPSPTEEEKAQLRDRARRLFVQRGIPQALTSVMGQAASREALEKIFDSLQVETVARGFVFSVLLQGLRVLTL